MSDESFVNSQIADAVAQINASVMGADRGLIAGAAYQAFAQAIALALQNAVAQQQQAYILRNALTTAAANAILEGKKEEADSILKLAESRAVSPSLSADISEILAAMKGVSEELRNMIQTSGDALPADSKAKVPAKSATA